MDGRHSRKLDWDLQVNQNNGTLVTVGHYFAKESRLHIDEAVFKSIKWANGAKEMPGTTAKKCKFLRAVEPFLELDPKLIGFHMVSNHGDNNYFDPSQRFIFLILLATSQ